MKRYTKILALLITLSPYGVFGQNSAMMNSVFQATSINRLTLESKNKPIERKLTIKKWFPNKIGRAKASQEFFAYFDEERIIIDDQMKPALNQKYFLKMDNNPNSEVWLIKDGGHIFIRSFSRTRPKEKKVDIYKYKGCDAECKENKMRGRLGYLISRPIIKYDPKKEKSFDEFEAKLIQKKIWLNNSTMRELKARFFNYKYFQANYKKNELVTWCLFLPGKFIIRVAREPDDINLDAYSIPHGLTKDKPLALKLKVDLFGFSTTNKNTASYLNTGVGLFLIKDTYNKWGELTITNNLYFFSHIILDDTKKENTYLASESFLVVQRLLDNWELFAGTDFYHDGNSGIIYGARVIPGFGYNPIGFNNKYYIDPVFSLGAGYRHEKNELAQKKTITEDSFNDIIAAYRFRIGNIEYGYQPFYWMIATEFQNTLVELDKGDFNSDFVKTFRLQVTSRIGLPFGYGKVFLGHLYEQLLLRKQEEETVNHRGMLSFEFKVR